jgi:hypothetical protein
MRADLFAFIFRRYAELVEFGGKEEWEGERELIESYVSKLAPRLVPISARWPKRDKGCPCARWYNDVAPQSLKELH